MGLKGRTPETGTGGITFTYDKCHGEPRKGWLSGDVHVLECHVGDSEKSKPCARVLLGTGAECKGCQQRRALESLGYVPLRDETGRPRCVIVRRDRIAFVAKMEPGTPVLWGREEGRFESVFVTHRPVNQKWEYYFSKPPADDMGYWLPLFLGCPDLAPAMRALFRGDLQCQPTVTEKPAPVPAVESLPPTVGELTVSGAPLPIIPPLQDTTRRLESRKARERANEDFVRRNGSHKV